MNLLVLGKGKTGSLVGEIARERGHSVRSVSSAEHEGGAALVPGKLAQVDVVIDFTAPDSVIHNITAIVRAKKNMVVGTTGWHAHLDRVRELVDLSGIGFIHGSNFSVGVNIFFEAARAVATASSFGYSIRLMEKHHAQKKDSPSGTAVTLQRIFAEKGVEPEVVAIREGDTIGTHAVLLDSEHDTMMLTHDAKSRRAFAEGAILAAEWIASRTGFYEFKDVFRQLKH
jgi:4-hydroxy-tetrahydrodipicolinate reductase